MDVAGALGIQVHGKAAQCWRASNHAHGDHHPSLGFTLKNRFRCFVCDARAGSNIDLVMKVLGCDLRAALQWIEKHFPVPDNIRIEQHDPGEWNRVTLDTIIKSGVWASALTDAERNVLTVLWSRRDHKTGACALSYRGVLKIAGLGSQSTVATAIQKFEEMRLLEVARASHVTSTYRFIEHPDFCELQRRTWETFQPKRRTATVTGAVAQHQATDLAPTATPIGADKQSKSQVLQPLECSNQTPIHRYLTPTTGAVSAQFSERERQVLRLAGRGLFVFPCRERAKEPAVRNWQRLATVDAAKVMSWFQQFPNANWGVATGARSNAFVLDVDGEQGLNTLHQFLREHGDEPQPDTLAVKTARGWHLYFAWPSAGRVPNSVGRFGPGLDIRGTGGYVLAPPSVHPSGYVYQWLAGEDRALQAAPAWLLEEIGQPCSAERSIALEAPRA